MSCRSPGAQLPRESNPAKYGDDLPAGFSAGGGMLGDAGANVLGAVLGLYAVLFGGNLLQLASLAILAVVHVLTEKVSLSAVIARQPLLRFLDHLGRTGQAE